MAKQKINVKLLRKIQKHILAEPRRLNMGTWGGKVEVISRLFLRNDAAEQIDRFPPPCGTVGCIAGWAYALSTKRPRHNFGGRTPEFAQKRLGISDAQSSRLFMLPAMAVDQEAWPEKFASKYEAAKTPAGRARVAARRIDHFIKTNGAE